MKVVGALAWYDESPSWLAAAVTGAAKLCDHMVAADGAYALYPGGRSKSDPEQSHAIIEAAYAAGVGLTIHQPDEVWMGNQVEKRTVMFNLACQVAGPRDWVFVFDADDLVTHVPHDARTLLEGTDMDAATYTLWWTEDIERDPEKAAGARIFPYPNYSSNRYHRGLFRALPGLRVEGAHYHYVAERDGRTVHLRGHADAHSDVLEPALDLTGMRVQHRHPQRPLHRLETSARYDRVIRGLGLEKVTSDDWEAVA